MFCANFKRCASFTYMWLHASCNNSPLHKAPWAWNHLREMWLLLQSLCFLWTLLTSVISFNPLSPTNLTLSLPIAATYGTIFLTWKRADYYRRREMKKRGRTKEVWLTTLILFSHTAAFQIDLHTAQCPFSLGFAVAGALECIKLEKPEKNRGRQRWGSEEWREQNSKEFNWMQN